MARRRAGLPDLVHMRQERKHGVPLAALIDERLAAAERCAGRVQEAENQLARLGDVDLAVGLFLGPAGAGDKKHFRVGANRLRVLLPGRGGR